MSSTKRSTIPDSSVINYYMSRDLNYLRKTEKKYKVYAEALACQCVGVRQQISELYTDLQDANALFLNARKMEAVVKKDKKRFDETKDKQTFPWCNQLFACDDVDYLAGVVNTENVYKQLKEQHDTLVSEVQELEAAVLTTYGSGNIDELYETLVTNVEDTKRVVTTYKTRGREVVTEEDLVTLHASELALRGSFGNDVTEDEINSAVEAIHTGSLTRDY